jgi:prevent-host-death family protein
MRSVNIAELKNHLSSYLNEVRAGEEIIIRDRDRPIARILPLRAEGDNEERLNLAAAGKIRLGNGEPIDEDFWSLPAPKLRISDLQRVIEEDRDED